MKNFQIKFSTFFLGANVHPPERKTSTHTSPIRSSCLVASLRMCQNGVMSSTFGPFFSICAFLPLLGSCEGKTPKRQVAGENKNKWRQLSPHPPSTQITSTRVHTPPSPPLHLLLGPHYGVMVRDDPNVSLF